MSTGNSLSSVVQDASNESKSLIGPNIDWSDVSRALDVSTGVLPSKKVSNATYHSTARFVPEYDNGYEISSTSSYDTDDEITMLDEYTQLDIDVSDGDADSIKDDIFDPYDPFKYDQIDAYHRERFNKNVRWVDSGENLNSVGLKRDDGMPNTQATYLGHKTEMDRYYSTINDYAQETINKIISDQITNPTNTLIIQNLRIHEIPSIVATLEHVKHMIVTQCDLSKLSNLPPYLEKLEVRANKLTSLRSYDLPSTLVELDASKNMITRVNLADSISMKVLNLSHNGLTDIVVFPPYLQELNLQHTDIRNTDAITPLNMLEILKINKTRIDNIDNLPDSIKQLYASRIDIGKNPATCGRIKKLPSNIEKLIMHSSGVTGFDFVIYPHTLTHIDLYDNELTAVPIFPDSVINVDISKNRLRSISNIPAMVESFDCNSNPDIVITEEQKNMAEALVLGRSATIIFKDYDIDTGMMYWEGTNYDIGYDRSGYGQNTDEDDPRCVDTLQILSDQYDAMQYTSNIESHTDFSVHSSSNSQVETQSPMHSQSLYQTPMTSNPRAHVTEMIGTTPNTSDRNQYNHPIMSSGFGHIGSIFNTNDRTDSFNGTNSVNSANRESAITPGISKMIGPDMYRPTKNKSRRVHHSHIYNV